MIRLERELSRVPARFRGAQLVSLSRDLVGQERERKQGLIPKCSFDSSVWRVAKDLLLAETFGKCAYCETPTAVVDFGDVEHYRPKSQYWWLAYCLENYLASCALCNQKYKKDKFPRLSGKLRAPYVAADFSAERLDSLAKRLVPDPLDAVAVEAYWDSHASEWPLLVNPYVDDPADYFAWRADVVLEEVELVAASTGGATKEVVAAAKAIYGLDRPELRRNRYFTFSSYRSRKSTLLDTGISAETRDRLEREILRMQDPDCPYAGMLRFFERQGGPDDWIERGFLTGA